MSKVRRAVTFQIGGLILGVAIFIGASRYFPVADFVAQVQQKVMHLGAWSAVWTRPPLLSSPPAYR